MHKARLPLIVFLSCFYAGCQPFALAQCSQQAGSFINRGNALLNARHYTEAIHQYEEALKLDPGCGVAKQNLAESHNHWGMYYYSQRKYREAMAEFQKALEIVPNHANAKRNIGIVNQAAAQQGIDLNAPEADAPEGNGGTAAAPGVPAAASVAEFDPLTGAPLTKQAGLISARKPPAPRASSKPAVAAKTFLQGSASTEPAPATVQGTPETPHAVSTEPPAGALILTPGLRVGPPPSPPGGQEDSFSSAGGPVSTVETSRPITSATASSAHAAPAPVTINPAADINMVTPQLPPARSQSASASTTPTTTPGLVEPATPGLTTSGAAPAPRAVRAAATGGSVEDQLSAIEIKMYGAPQSSLSAFQRLEKMERDVSGQPRSGNIMERINFLKQNIGM